MLKVSDVDLNLWMYGMVMPKLTLLVYWPRVALIDAPLPVPLTFASE